MRDAKDKTATKTAAKKGQNKTAKSSAKKSAGADKSNKAKGKTAADTAPDGKVFRVDQNGSPVRTVDRKTAVADIVKEGAFTEETVNKMLDAGEVAYQGDAFYFATSRKALAKWEKEQGSAPADDTHQRSAITYSVRIDRRRRNGIRKRGQAESRFPERRP
jgi:hypothetical protein